MKNSAVASQLFGAIAAFQSYLEGERHFSPYTARCYGADLKQYFDYQAGSFDFTPKGTEEEIFKGFKASTSRLTSTSDLSACASVTEAICRSEPRHIELFIAHLNDQKYSQATVCRKIASLRSFHKWLERTGVAAQNPMTAVRSPKQQKGIPAVMFNDAGIEALLNTKKSSDILGARDQAILGVLVDTGITMGEMGALKVEDCDLKSGVIKIRSGTRKERRATLSTRTIADLARYLELRGKHSVHSESRSRSLFINKHGSKLSPRSVRRKFDNYLEAAGLDPTLSPRSVRHWRTVRELANGKPQHEVQAENGLASPATLNRYAMMAFDLTRTGSGSNGKNSQAVPGALGPSGQRAPVARTA